MNRRPPTAPTLAGGAIDPGEAGRPVLLAASSASAIMNGAGELAFPRETRGALLDWGGIYAMGVRLTGPWRVRVDEGNGPYALGVGTLRRMRSDPWGAVVEHQVGSTEVRAVIAPRPDAPGVGLSWTVKAPTGPIALDIAFEPYLMPVLIEGVRPAECTTTFGSTEAVIVAHGFCAVVRPSRGPALRSFGNAPSEGGAPDGPPSISIRWQLGSPNGTDGSVGVSVLGGLESLRHTFPKDEPTPGAVLQSGEAVWERWVSATPTMEFPDSPDLETAYDSARRALRSLYAAPEPGIEGLVAGHPWYSAIWGRDLAWMLPAVGWLGDHEVVERSLAAMFRFQARAKLPVLGGSPGEIPMQLSAGPIYLYGTSDTTLYFPSLVADLVHRTGSTGLADRFGPNLERIVEWGISRSDPASGLVRNGGEVEEIAEEASIGRVRVGFDAVDTTIWDSTDRRDHAIDVQVLWAQSLESALELLPNGDRAKRSEMTRRLTEVRRAIGERYRWPEESYLADSLHLDGTRLLRLRPNALRVVSAGLLDRDGARAVVRRASQPDLLTPWGVRTLSSNDPSYRPTAYHDGQVWTIATCWLAEAALASGETEIALTALRTVADRYRSEDGYANECYRGDRPEPYDSCFLLGLSVAPFLSTLFGGLWGLKPAMQRSELAVDPHFPSEWRSARVRGLRIGNGSVDLGWTPERLEVGWTGATALQVRSAAETVEIAPGGRAMVALPGTSHV